MSKVKVLIVDDSVFMRKAIEAMLAKEPDMEVVGLAVNGQEAVDMTAELKPDIITLDIEMPVMDGLTALEIIMDKNPTVTIMVSSLTQTGADATLKALDLGAVDFIPKESNSFGGLGLERELKEKIRKFAKNSAMMKLITSKRLTSAKSNVATAASAATKLMTKKGANKSIVALGTSTGGPQSLQKVIPLLPADLGVPIVITQHMPPNFTASLAARLDSLSKLQVIEAQGKEKLEPNVVYIAKGGQHLTFRKVGASIYTELTKEPSDLFNIPSVDVMVSSLTKLYKDDILGVIMTGMGSDGAIGLKELHAAGGTIVSQDEASCVVYGMPKSVVDLGIAHEIVPLEEISKRIIYHCK